MSGTQKNIVLIGGGGHCKSCIDVIRGTDKYKIIGILDVPQALGKKVSGIEIIGTDEDYLKYHRQECSFLITVGQIKNPETRIGIYAKLKSLGAYLETIVAPTAYVSESAIVGEGTIIMHNAFINVGVSIGINNIVNTAAVIEHDVEISNHNHISTGAIVNGDCKIGDGNFLGSCSCISNGVTIGNWAIIGAGSTVTRNIHEKGVYLGTPAKKR